MLCHWPPQGSTVAIRRKALFVCWGEGYFQIRFGKSQYWHRQGSKMLSPSVMAYDKWTRIWADRGRKCGIRPICNNMPDKLDFFFPSQPVLGNIALEPVAVLEMLLNRYVHLKSLWAPVKTDWSPLDRLRRCVEGWTSVGWGEKLIFMLLGVILQCHLAR